jgi:hypothetical protein
MPGPRESSQRALRGLLFFISVHECSSAVRSSSSAFISVYQRSKVLHQQSSAVKKQS